MRISLPARLSDTLRLSTPPYKALRSPQPPRRPLLPDVAEPLDHVALRQMVPDGLGATTESFSTSALSSYALCATHVVLSIERLFYLFLHGRPEAGTEKVPHGATEHFLN